MNILIINGFEKHVDANGQLNNRLFTEYVRQFKDKHDTKITVIEDYKRIEEINKWLWADLIIIQFPIYWFNVPGALKSYFDDVFAYGIFYGLDYTKYGQGGRLFGKKFMLSTTWNAPTAAFNDNNQFFNGMSVSDILQPTIKALEFIGLTSWSQDGVISCHDVIHNPEIELYLSEQKQFIEEVNV
ncbi:NAD(P)H dehydrogenase (quinone) [Leuconostoc gasicomitatum]|uniref:MdaB protein homolog n=2 Tax=Leuconostoc TaxID=1243 RepID=A0AAN2QWE9_9LACO|nr:MULTISPECIES: NAD(P)H-dependent oxidoreductase [Leuconostoc]MBZ5947581.1 NAD(P)H-dependent oxidoreductase [Leuconostoc gasicomitatum]MBZ5957111.1 NAD(P)H-dependent oxidoreductase [Leuconostoc gasicomitatum]MBZ5958497.1 NAD(P)H-dependent oxidoreductase [Leuconostoc gasicomitatum]MBZ5960393.1 NAD(P)H-dependent oxidoreductase [Leuconostoc gasicomitatum]MBZ5965461.1 NAD(P)H-dependent oxidoreductase [Leuconostoc gasicomitatum]